MLIGASSHHKALSPRKLGDTPGMENLNSAREGPCASQDILSANRIGHLVRMSAALIDKVIALHLGVGETVPVDSEFNLRPHVTI